MSPIFSKKISRFCSFSSRPYFFLSFPIFARKRTGIFYSTHIVKWNNHVCSKIQRVLILLAWEIGNTTFHNPTYWFKYQCIQQYFSNYIWERNQIMLKKIHDLHFFYAYFLLFKQSRKNRIQFWIQVLAPFHNITFWASNLIFDQYFLRIKFVQ